MYYEDLVYRIQEGSEDSLMNLYLANYGLIYRLAGDFGVPERDLDDFKQLCYFALLEAVRVFPKEAEYSFTACFRLCARSAYSQYKLHNSYPVSITRWGVRKLGESGELPCATELSSYATPYLDYYFDQVERRMLCEVFWDRLEEVLASKNVLVLRMRYVGNKTYKEIGKELGIGAERARLRHNRALKRLKHDDVVREIASSFGIL